MMAASVPSNKVRDRKYINWLKVTLALSHLKNGIHSFIENEVRIMHKSLLKSIYGKRHPRKCKQCDSRDIRWNGSRWEFPSSCTLDCGKWLDELQALFSSNIDPNRIYWSNSLVREWPFNPWECAKVFLPRGQVRSSMGPGESDSQALMTLLTNCQHFSNKLSQQGQSLTYDISGLRNNVMHSADMKVSDQDLGTYINKYIISFLQDPVFMSLEECKTAVANIQKIEKSSLDVFWDLDQEITALSAGISEIRLQLGMEVKKNGGDMESLKEEYKELRELLIKRLEDFEHELNLHGTKIDTIKSNIQKQEKKHKEMDTAVTSLEGRLDVVEENVQNVDTKLQALEANTDTALQQQEKKHQEMEITVTKLSESTKTMSADIASHEGRLDACEENVQLIGTKLQEFEKTVEEGISDNDTSERRQESDGLRQLKNATEDRLDTFRKNGFIQTTQTEEVKKLLQEKRSVVIKGNPGEGKTSTALHLIDNDDYKRERMVISQPKEWKKVDTGCVKIVVLEDICGKYDLNPKHLKKWIDYLRAIQKHVDEGKLQVIITIRDYILLQAYSKLKSFKFFFSDMSVTLSSEKLKHSEKISILNRELQRNKKDMNIKNKEQCIANFSGLIGFPQCCSLFAEDKDLFEQGPKFFKSPEKFFVNNITNLKTDSFLSLAFLFCNEEIEEEYLSLSQIKKSKNYLPVLKELALSLNMSLNESTMTLVRMSYDYFLGLYVKKVFSYEHHSGGHFSGEHHSEGSVRKSCIRLSDATVYEAVGQVLGDRCPEMIVKYGDSGYLYRRTYTAKATDNTSQNVLIPVSELLVDRMVHDVVKKRLAKSVVKHSALKQDKFLIKLKHELQNNNKIKDFLMANPYSKLRFFHQNLSGGECITFLQYILQSDEDTVRLVYSHFTEFLECTHNTRSSDCWECNEKQKLLELALYYRHFQIADKLIEMNACYTLLSLYNAVRHEDLSRIETILEYLKNRQVFSPECIEAKLVLCRATMSGNQYVREILLEEGITLDSKYVIYFVQHGDRNILMKVVEHLKCHIKWFPHWEQYIGVLGISSLLISIQVHSDMTIIKFSA